MLGVWAFDHVDECVLNLTRKSGFDLHVEDRFLMRNDGPITAAGIRINFRCPVLVFLNFIKKKKTPMGFEPACPGFFLLSLSIRPTRRQMKPALRTHEATVPSSCQGFVRSRRLWLHFSVPDVISANDASSKIDFGRIIDVTGKFRLFFLEIRRGHGVGNCDQASKIDFRRGFEVLENGLNSSGFGGIR